MRRPNDTCPAPEANSIPNATRRPHSITYAIRNRRHMGAPARGQTAIQGHHGICFGISSSGALYRCFIAVPNRLHWLYPLVIIGRTGLNEAHCSTKLMASRSRKRQGLSSISFCRARPPADPIRLDLQAHGKGAPPARSMLPRPLFCGAYIKAKPDKRAPATIAAAYQYELVRKNPVIGRRAPVYPALRAAGAVLGDSDIQLRPAGPRQDQRAPSRHWSPKATAQSDLSAKAGY